MWVPLEVINSRFCSKTRQKMFLLVSVRHVGAHPNELQHGVSIQSSINLVKHFLGYLVYEVFLRPKSWRESLYIYLLSFPRFWTLSMVLISILIYFEWRDTENQQYASFYIKFGKYTSITMQQTSLDGKHIYGIFICWKLYTRYLGCDRTCQLGAFVEFCEKSPGSLPVGLRSHECDNMPTIVWQLLTSFKFARNTYRGLKKIVA